MTVGDAGASAARQDDPDELGLDITYYARVLWRYRLLIAVVTLAGGAGGWMISRMATRVYVGTARLTISQAQGSVVAADAVMRYQVQLKTDPVMTATLKDLALDRPPANATVADLRSAVSSRVEPPRNMLIVEAIWNDADLAARIAGVVAQKGLEAALEQHRKAALRSQEVLRGQIDNNARLVAETQIALLDFRRKNGLKLGPGALDGIEAQHHELAAVIVEIAAERARLRTARELLARTPATIFLERDLAKPARFEATNPVHTEIARQMMESQGRLVGLEAKRDFYTRSDKERASQDSGGVAIETIHTQLKTAAREAQQTLAQLSEMMVLALKARATSIGELQMVDEPLETGRRVGRSTSAHVARGLAIGLVLSIFGVLFFHGLSASTFSRRT